MAKYFYKAKRQDGGVYEGAMDAADRFELYNLVRKEGGAVISVREGGKRRFNMEAINEFLGSVKTQEKITFAKNLAAMVRAGFSISRALSVMERQTKNAKLRKVLSGISSDIRQGIGLNVALEKYPDIFPRLFVSMVRSGEESGNLAESLEVIAAQTERAHQLAKKVRGALIYPSIIVFAMVVIGILMLVFVVPTLTQTFEELGAELPATTQGVIAVSNFLTNNTVLALFLFLALVTMITLTMRTDKGKKTFEFIILHIPIIGDLVKEVNAARTARTLSSLLSAGVDVILAISITGEVVQNTSFKAVLRKAEKDVQTGTPMSKVFIENEHLYPVLVGEMMAVGEETGKLSDMLQEIAEFYEQEVEQKTKDMSTIIEPFLMILIGGVVGFFAISMIAPIYSLSDSI